MENSERDASHKLKNCGLNLSICGIDTGNTEKKAAGKIEFWFCVFEE